jgi:hypothetical protein
LSEGAREDVERAVSEAATHVPVDMFQTTLKILFIVRGILTINESADCVETSVAWPMRPAGGVS